MMKRFILPVLMILLMCLPAWAMAADISIGDGETVTLSGTLTEGYNIQLGGKGTLVLDHVHMTSSGDYAALEINGSGSLNIIYKGSNTLINEDNYGIFAENAEITLTPGSADALLRIDISSDGNDGIFAYGLNLAEGAKVNVNSSGSTAVTAFSLHIGENAMLNATGRWHGIDVIFSGIIGKNAQVNAHGGFIGLLLRIGDMTIEEGAEVTLSSDGARSLSGSPLSINIGNLLIENEAKVDASTDNTYAAVMILYGSITVEEGAVLSGVNDRPVGVGLMMDENSFIKLNSDQVTLSGGANGAVSTWLFTGYEGGPGKIQLGSDILAQHRSSAAEPWEEMTGSTTGKRFFRTAKAVEEVPPEIIVPETGDEANVLLWSALAAVSMLGMMMLVRRRKGA